VFVFDKFEKIEKDITSSFWSRFFNEGKAKEREAMTNVF